MKNTYNMPFTQILNLEAEDVLTTSYSDIPFSDNSDPSNSPDTEVGF